MSCLLLAMLSKIRSPCLQSVLLKVPPRCAFGLLPPQGGCFALGAARRRNRAPTLRLRLAAPQGDEPGHGAVLEDCSAPGESEQHASCEVGALGAARRRNRAPTLRLPTQSPPLSTVFTPQDMPLEHSASSLIRKRPGNGEIDTNLIPFRRI